MKFDCKVFDLMPNRDIFAKFHGPGITFGSRPLSYGLRDCKWVDTGQIGNFARPHNLELVISTPARIIEWTEGVAYHDNRTLLLPQQQEAEGILTLATKIEGLSILFAGTARSSHPVPVHKKTYVATSIEQYTLEKLRNCLMQFRYLSRYSLAAIILVYINGTDGFMLGTVLRAMDAVCVTKYRLEKEGTNVKLGQGALLFLQILPPTSSKAGDGDFDHYCWERAEDMTTPRTAYKLDPSHPGSDLAGEAVAALAAASLAFKPYDSSYSNLLLVHAKQLFSLADTFRGLYDDSIPNSQAFYTSSGYSDELLWAAAWLYQATYDEYYLKYVVDNVVSLGGTGWQVKQFSWDNKYAGVQILLTKILLDGAGGSYTLTLKQYQAKADYFTCACLTPGGLIYVREWNNLQYASSAAFLLAMYSGYLSEKKVVLTCPEGQVQPSDILLFAKSQADYILGKNPKAISYLVGYGQKYPIHVHHRGASITPISVLHTAVSCIEGFETWYRRPQANPIIEIESMSFVLVGDVNLVGKSFCFAIISWLLCLGRLIWPCLKIGCTTLHRQTLVTFTGLTECSYSVRALEFAAALTWVSITEDDVFYMEANSVAVTRVYWNDTGATKFVLNAKYVPIPEIMLLYSNLEDKVLFEGGRIVMNITKMEDPCEKMSNYIWDPGKMPIYRRGKCSIRVDA